MTLEELKRLLGFGDEPGEPSKKEEEKVVVHTPETVSGLTYFDNLPWSWHKHVLNYEGGYVNHPNDKGGETNRGITLATLNRAKKRGIVPQHISIKELHKYPDHVYNIYNIMYYCDSLCNQMPAMLAFAFHDACVNHGRGGRGKSGRPIGAGMLLQDVLISKFDQKISYDGIAGRETIEALNRVLKFVSEATVTDAFNERRRKYFRDIATADPSQKVFLNGWMNRMDKVCRMCRDRVM